MSWRDNLRPGSFRGVRFEATRHRKGQGRRGPHHQYPNRDRGWVEDLGLNDKRLTLDAYVIGNDYMARRDALDAAMHQKGTGELIHPWLGRIEAVPDPDADQNFTESSEQGGMARFQLSFLNASDTPALPSVSAVGAERAVRQAAAVRAAVIGAAAARMILSGPAPIAAAASAEMDVAIAEVEAVRPLVGAPEATSGLLDATSFSAGARLGIASFDPFAALIALADLVLAITTILRAGERLLAKAEGVDAATRTLLAPRKVRVPDNSIAGRRIAANAQSISDVLRLTALGQSAQAVTARKYDTAEDAFESLRLIDREVETAIRAEADTGGDADLVRALTDLRATTRETLLANAADLVPIATIDPKVSLPGLALSWFIDGSIESERDVLARNRVSHPFWCPAEAVQVKVGRNA